MVKTYTKKQFIEDVKKEARALKENATKEETSRLDFDDLDPNSPTRCVYGQMTGSCQNDRAVDLIKKCCVRVIHNCIDDFDGAPRPMSVISKHVNGKVPEDFRDNRHDSSNNIFESITYLSPLETYIASPFGKNANLIAYLKGERNDLVL